MPCQIFELVQRIQCLAWAELVGVDGGQGRFDRAGACGLQGGGGGKQVDLQFACAGAFF